MKQHKRKIVIDPILNFEWMLQYGDTEESAHRWFCKRNRLNFDDQSFDNDRRLGSFTYNEGQVDACLIWVKEKRGCNTMTHEVAHAVLHLCKELKIDPILNGEFFARYTGWLNGEFSDLYYRK